MPKAKPVNLCRVRACSDGVICRRRDHGVQDVDDTIRGEYIRFRNQRSVDGHTAIIPGPNGEISGAKSE